MRLRPAPEDSPGIQRLLADALARHRRALGRDELRAEVAVGGGFLLAATALALAAPLDRSVDVADAALVFVGLVLGSRVVFEVGSCYTVPVQIAFVPALFVVPPQLVPLLVAGAFLVATSIDVLQGARRPSRLINILGDSWFAIGPALVLVLAGGPEASEVQAAVVGSALLAQFAFETASSRAREWLHGGASLREQFTESAWIYLVDLLLSPVGFAVAVAAALEPAAVALAWPVFLLLGIFARERDERLVSLLELSEAYRGTARVLGEVVEQDDAYTGLHIRGVAELAVEIGADLGLDPQSRRLVEFGALLHDVGKIAIPKQIINKPGPLNELEWQVIRTHTVEGQRMLEEIGGLMSEVGRVVRHSHERWDGGGYPDGLAGEAIPIESRIVFCCDAYNAMTTDRAYRPALSPGEAATELRSGVGSQFDPRVVEAVLRRVAPEPARGPARAARLRVVGSG